MKQGNTFDLSGKLQNLDGNDLDATGTTMAKAVAQALVNPPKQPFADPGENLRRYVLAMRVNTDPKPSLVAEEILSIKAALADMFSPLVAGQIIVVLDNVKLGADKA